MVCESDIERVLLEFDLPELPKCLVTGVSSYAPCQNILTSVQTEPRVNVWESQCYYGSSDFHLQQVEHFRNDSWHIMTVSVDKYSESLIRVFTLIQKDSGKELF